MRSLDWPDATREPVDQASLFRYSTGPTYTFLPFKMKYARENITTKPYIRMFQFIRSGVGCGKVGKNANVNATHR